MIYFKNIFKFRYFYLFYLFYSKIISFLKVIEIKIQNNDLKYRNYFE